MAEYRSQQWKDNISIAKRMKAAERRKQMLSVEEYAREAEAEQQAMEREDDPRGVRIDFDAMTDLNKEVTRPFAPTSVESDDVDER